MSLLYKLNSNKPITRERLPFYGISYKSNHPSNNDIKIFDKYGVNDVLIKNFLDWQNILNLNIDVPETLIKILNIALPIKREGGEDDNGGLNRKDFISKYKSNISDVLLSFDKAFLYKPINCNISPIGVDIVTLSNSFLLFFNFSISPSATKLC